MSYQISSDRLNNPTLLELLKVLANYFQAIDNEFYIVGAAARDIVLGAIYQKSIGRKTKDLDIAIMIPNWNAFNQIAEGLCSIPDFKKSEKQKQRFYYKDLLLDIVPFGEIAGSGNNIYWPPEDSQAMSVTGFTEMAKKALSVTIDNAVRISVASLPGIFILKLAAWRDRCRFTNKDAADILLIIDEYLEINLERAVKEHQDIYESEDFNTFIAGAILMGRDVKMILMDNFEVLVEVSGIIESEIIKAEHSLLINQMLETHRSKKYEEIYEALISIRNELKR